jgi:hypothetical protein
MPTGARAWEDREIRKARERAERAARRANRAAQKVSVAEGRAAARHASAGEILQSAGDAASAALTAVSAVADEASGRIAAKQRLNALDQALVTARAGGRVDIAPPTRKEALLLAERSGSGSATASFVRGVGLLSAAIVAITMLSIGGFGWLGWAAPIFLLVASGSVADRMSAARRRRVADRIQLELARAALPAQPVAKVEVAQAPKAATGAVTAAPVTGADRTPRLVEEGDLRTTAEILAALDRLVARVTGLVEPEDVAAIRRIRDAAALALPSGDGALDLTDHETWLARQICTDYLPRAIEHYLALPQGLALEPMLEGRSARQVLDEQLDLIERRLRAMAERTYRREAGGLLNHARFVADSLRPDPFGERMAELASAEPVIEANPASTTRTGSTTARERDRA